MLKIELIRFEAADVITASLVTPIATETIEENENKPVIDKPPVNPRPPEKPF